MIQSIQSQPFESPRNEPAKRESEQGQFAEALELQTTTLLSAVLDPSATASLPGAGTALVQAESADADVSSIASQQLSRQESRKGTRERGLDAASQARQDLAKQGAAAQQSTETSEFQPTARAHAPVRAESSAPSSPEAQAESKASTGTQTSTTSDQHTGSGASNSQQTNASQTAPQAILKEAASAAGTAVSGTVASSNASNAAGSTSTGVGAVSQASAGGGAKPTPTMLAGNGSAPLKEGAEKAGSRVIRHEPRNFEAQLQRSLAQVLRQRGGTLSLKLDPAELGSVKVSLSLSQGRVEGTIEASSERARGLLHEHLDTLKGSLEQRGITVDRLEVRLAGAAESERQFAAGQDAGRGLDQQSADAGGDRQSGSFRGEDRQAGDWGRNPGERTKDGLRGAEPTSDDWPMQGGMAEPLGGWLRLDTLA